MAACLAHTILLKVTLIVCAETEEYQNDKLLLVFLGGKEAPLPLTFF